MKKHDRLWVTLLLGIQCVYIFLLFWQVPLNSDHANQVLQGKDILAGNVLLHDWNLTGVSFYLSEIPFYTLGTALFGVSPRAYIFAASLMIVLLFILAFRTAYTEADVPNALLFIVLCGMPTLTRLGYLRGHCAIFLYFFGVTLCVRSLFRKVTIPRFVFYLLLLICGCMSDMTLFLLSVIPVMLISGLNLLRNGCRSDRKTNSLLLLLSPAAAACGMAADKLLMKLGGINKNSFLDTRKFMDISKTAEKIRLIGKGLFDTYNGIPGGIRGIVSQVLIAAILLWTLLSAVKALKAYIRQDTIDPVPALLTLGLMVMGAACFFTDIYTSEDSARYIAVFPFISAALIGSEFERTELFKQKWLPLACCAAILFLLQPVRLQVIETPQDRLAAFLQEHGLTNGYSSFWNASHTTVSSGDTVHVRSVRIHEIEVGVPKELSMQNWFCKNEWYREPADFVVLGSSTYLGVNEHNIRILLGDPAEILDNGEYRVFCYDHDITPYVVFE